MYYDQQGRKEGRKEGTKKLGMGEVDNREATTPKNKLY